MSSSTVSVPGYYQWRYWRVVQGGVPALRPPGLPAFIPPLWWVRLAIYKTLIAKPALGLLAEPGVLLSNPSGPDGIDHARRMFRNGFRWYLYNLRRGPWDTWLSSAKLAGLETGPWMRCYTVDEVRLLIANAIWEDAPIVGINLEYTADKITTVSPEQVAEEIKVFEGQVVIIVSPWMEDDPNWKALAARCVFLIEGFTNENGPDGKPWRLSELVSHALSRGVRTLAVMAGIYPATNPYPTSLVEWQAQGGTTPILYLGDNLGADEGRWAAWSPASLSG